MGWLQRLFGKQEEEKKQRARGGQGNRAAQSGGGVAQAPAATSSRQSSSNAQSIPPERVGLDGEYDESGLAKRVAAAFDDDPSLDDIDTLYVAQTGGTVVLKGKAPSQQILSKMATVAKGVRGASAVDTSQVTIG
jgi:osmotically-inducible protein OsmY